MLCAAGLPQQSVAEQLGVHQSTVSRWVRGQTARNGRGKPWQRLGPRFGTAQLPRLVTELEVFTLFEDQGFSCAVCGTTDFGKRGPQLDHCHESGVVRGLLCMNCNAGLGHFDDNPEMLGAALSYLAATREAEG